MIQPIMIPAQRPWGRGREGEIKGVCGKNGPFSPVVTSIDWNDVLVDGYSVED